MKTNKQVNEQHRLLLSGLQKSDDLARIIEMQDHLDIAATIYASVAANNSNIAEDDIFSVKFANILSSLVDPIERLIGRVVYNELFIIRRAVDDEQTDN